MRRLVIFALVLVLSAGLIAGTCVSLFDRQDDVEVREVTAFGDRSAAGGLRVQFHSVMNNLCTWDTSLTLGGGEIAPESVFTWAFDHMELDTFWMWHEYFTMELWDPGFSPYISQSIPTAYARNVVNRTNPGERRCEVVHPADYFEYWPWNVVAAYREEGWSFTRHLDAQGDRGVELSELFRVKLPEELMAEVWVNKNDKGEVTSMFSSVTDAWHEPVVDSPEDNYGTYTIQRTPLLSDLRIRPCGTADGRGIWLYPTVLDASGENVLEYRDGQGLYFIPAATAEIWNSLSASEILALDPGELIVNRAKLLYSTDETPVYVRLSRDGGAVQLYTKVDDTLWLTVLDPQTGEVLDRVEIMPMEGEELQLTVEKDELLLYMDYGGNLTVLEERGSGEEPVFHVKLDKEISFEGLGRLDECLFDSTDYLDFAFDGARLALANGIERTVLTADRSGVTYLARLNFSPLWDGVTDEEKTWYASAMGKYDGLPMEVSFH